MLINAYSVLPFFIVAIIHAVEAGDGKRDGKCMAWQRIQETLMNRDNLNVTCTVNPVCTGLTCNGAYIFTKMPAVTTLLNKRDVKVTFSIEFIECSSPLKVSVYLDLEGEVLKRDIDVQQGHQIINISIPGSAKYVHAVVSGELNFGLNHTFTEPDAQQRLVNLEMNVTLIIELVLMNASYLPAARKTLVLIPLVDVPIPECKTEGKVIPIKPSSIDNDSFTGAKCIPDTYAQCGDRQVCKPSSSGAVATMNGRCACWVGLFWDSQSQLCVDKVPTHVTAASEATNTNTVLMALGIVVGVLLVVTVVTVTVVKYRRYRQRYGQHDLLATTDDEPIDDDANNDTQMLPA